MTFRNLKKIVKSHRHLLRIARFVLRRRSKKLLVYSWSDVNLMVDDWCRFLPRDFDCVIGIPRSGLMIADQISLNLGLPLSTPEDFIRGVVWQSRVLNLPSKFKRVLVVDDCVDVGRELTLAVFKLRRAFPETVFMVGALIRMSGKIRLDYYYVEDSSYSTQGDAPKQDDRGVWHGTILKYDDFN